MKTLKETIQEHFVVAMKAKDENAKSALSGIKAKITEAEKANGNNELTDAEVIKVLTKAIKQRRESQEIYEKAGREELARKEADEALVLERYMPAQMTPQEISDALAEILHTLGVFLKICAIHKTFVVECSTKITINFSDRVVSIQSQIVILIFSVTILLKEHRPIIPNLDASGTQSNGRLVILLSQIVALRSHQQSQFNVGIVKLRIHFHCGLIGRYRIHGIFFGLE